MKQSAKTPIVIFDWDGTLVDSIGLISRTLSSAAVTLGAELSVDDARQVIGLGLPQAAISLFPAAAPEFIEAFVVEYKRQFIQVALEPQPFAGAAVLLDQLRNQGIALSVATGKARVGLNRALDATQWHDYFFATRCADETRSKPHPMMVEEILSEFRGDAGPVFLVGDTTHDVYLAHNAGVNSIAVTTGAHLQAELEASRPHYLCNSLQEAIEIILKASELV